MSPFGVPLDRLHALAAEHQKSLSEAEAIAMAPIVFQDDTTEAEVTAFTRFRAIAMLKATFTHDPAALAPFVAGIDFDQVRFEL